MGEFHYRVARCKHGWAYCLDNTYSPIFATSWEAIEAAKLAAREMHEPGDNTTVRVQDGRLSWRTVLVIKRTQPNLLNMPTSDQIGLPAMDRR
jgi:hypothetical protein